MNEYQEMLNRLRTYDKDQLTALFEDLGSLDQVKVIAQVAVQFIVDRLETIRSEDC